MNGRRSDVSFMHGDQGKAVSCGKESSAKQIFFIFEISYTSWGDGGGGGEAVLHELYKSMNEKYMEFSNSIKCSLLMELSANVFPL